MDVLTKNTYNGQSDPSQYDVTFLVQPTVVGCPLNRVSMMILQPGLVTLVKREVGDA